MCIYSTDLSFFNEYFSHEFERKKYMLFKDETGQKFLLILILDLEDDD